VAINVETRLSPGWWMDRLFRRLSDHKRYDRLEQLHKRYHGDPPLPEGNDVARELFTAFQRKARTNYAELAVSAVSERMKPVGFRTAADGDETGDQEAITIWERARMNIVAADVHDLMLNLGEAFVIVGWMDEGRGVPVVTAEDPRWMVGEPDPVDPYRLRAALKFLRDDIEGEDRAYLFLPGEVWVAVRDAPLSQFNAPTGPMYWAPENWSWDAERSGRLGHSQIPVVRFQNKDGAGEYEKHVDILDRINYQTLNRLCTAALQAFRQRAIETPDADSDGIATEDEDGRPIDYSEVFTSDPGAIWFLPPGARIWESGAADMRQILEINESDIIQFAATTKTPMYYLNPGGANQSADGASMQRESLVFKVEDRIERCKPLWSEVMGLIFHVMGDSERADVSKIQSLWANADRLSLAEKADAANKVQSLIPWRSMMKLIFDFDPQTIERMQSEREEEQLIALQQQLLLQAQEQAAANAKSLDPNAGKPGNDDGDNTGAKAAAAVAGNASAQLASLGGLTGRPAIASGTVPSGLRA
jgi:SPP1 Gp6-like portal protein